MMPLAAILSTIENVAPSACFASADFPASMAVADGLQSGAKSRAQLAVMGGPFHGLAVRFDRRCMSSGHV
jgi:hypothetical protein